MIAIDVMGGDYSPQSTLHGALIAARHNIPVALFGPEDVIVNFLAEHEPCWELLPIKVHHAPDLITMDDEPVSAVRRGSKSSLVQAVQSIKNKECEIVISAGNSGALMIASMLILGKHEGIERLPIAGFLPSIKGHVIGLDLGANTECRPQHLVQFAQLGNEYAKNTLGIEYPRIGLLANGHEDSKGSKLGKETFPLLKAMQSINFQGNIEPLSIINHEVDVVVCDGFAGNILLKTMEASYDLFTHLLEKKLNTDEQKPIIAALSNCSPKKQAGALLLGLKGKVVVCHGNSDSNTMYRAIKFAFSLKKEKKEAINVEQRLFF